jgi:mRNA-degrading endonuclease RelE of RelBE toxin-antitoxin system
MRFVETPVFTDAIRRLATDESYRALQTALLLRPQQGPLIRGSGGLRKLRWAAPGRGKRGGIRVVYYWDAKSETVYMLLAYAKSSQEDLTPTQLRMLARIVREEFG